MFVLLAGHLAPLVLHRAPGTVPRIILITDWRLIKTFGPGSEHLFGEPLQILETVDSTNRYALAWAEAPHGAAVVALAQTGGRGRLGRSWNSPPDRGLYLSVVLRSFSDAQLSRLSLVIALATAGAASELSGLRVGTKWPNDIVAQDSHGEYRKIGGILCEARAETAAPEPGAAAGRRVVAGIGLNLTHRPEDLPERPVFPASSLCLLSGREIPALEALPVVLAHLERQLAALEAGEWSRLRAEFTALCAGMGEVGTVRLGQDTVYGLLREIDDEGALVLATADGPRRILAGDVALI